MTIEIMDVKTTKEMQLGRFEHYNAEISGLLETKTNDQDPETFASDEAITDQEV